MYEDIPGAQLSPKIKGIKRKDVYRYSRAEVSLEEIHIEENLKNQKSRTEVDEIAFGKNVAFNSPKVEEDQQPILNLSPVRNKNFPGHITNSFNVNLVCKENHDTNERNYQVQQEPQGHHRGFQANQFNPLNLKGIDNTNRNDVEDEKKNFSDRLLLQKASVEFPPNEIEKLYKTERVENFQENSSLLNENIKLMRELIPVLEEVKENEARGKSCNGSCVIF